MDLEVARASSVTARDIPPLLPSAPRVRKALLLIPQEAGERVSVCHRRVP